MYLSQVYNEANKLQVVARSGHEAYVVEGANSVYELVCEAIENGNSIADQISNARLGAAIDLEAVGQEGRFASPIHHEDPAHTYVTGTGLTHLGSASTRDNMHTDEGQEANQSDTMKMFRLGLKGGKPETGQIGVAPEWFYKGNGTTIVPPNHAISLPNFAKDAGEEPEVAGIYVNGKDGQPHRVGFAIANEFSDHVIEKENYLYLAHSKLRQSSFGPEIYVGEFPASIVGNSQIVRRGEVIWQKEFLSGAENMSHSIANLEHHHFKYDLFRQPNDLHIHMFGTATLSFSDGIKVEDGDEFVISAPSLGQPLKNRVAFESGAPAQFVTLPL
jgi:hypothetical protein